MEFEYLETSRVKLRKLDQQVFDFIFTIYSDEQLMNFLGLKTQDELELEKIRYKKGFSTHSITFTNFQLIEKESNQIIGTCGFHTWYVNHSRAEIGYSLLEDEYKGKGYMSEAMESILDYGFKTMQLNRIEAFVGEHNIPSLKLMQKFGFIQEGHLKQHYFKNEVHEDSLAFALLRSRFLN